MTTPVQASPSALAFKALTSTFLTADSPDPSDMLVNFITTVLGPSIIVCEVTASAIDYSFISPRKSMALYSALPFGGSAFLELDLVVTQASFSGVFGSSGMNFPALVLALFLSAI
jgi:hypothetical protein